MVFKGKGQGKFISTLIVEARAINCLGGGKKKRNRGKSSAVFNSINRIDKSRFRNGFDSVKCFDSLTLSKYIISNREFFLSFFFFRFVSEINGESFFFSYFLRWKNILKYCLKSRSKIGSFFPFHATKRKRISMRLSTFLR